MIKATINVEKELWAKALIKEKSLSTLFYYLRYYSGQFSYAWIVVAIVDYFTENIDLIFIHLISLMFLVIIASIYTFFIWKKDFINSESDYSFKVELDETGVNLVDSNIFHEWSYYEYYKEYENYLLIRANDGYSVLPKNNELLELIQFTKKMISNKK